MLSQRLLQRTEQDNNGAISPQFKLEPLYPVHTQTHASLKVDHYFFLFLHIHSVNMLSRIEKHKHAHAKIK
jgi:hypothetical protein